MRMHQLTRVMSMSFRAFSWMAVSTLLIGGMGCALFAPQAQPEPVQAEAPPPPPEPTLRVAQDAHLTLFGEMPDRKRVPFQSHASSPMKQHSFITEGADFDVDMSPDGKRFVFSSTRHSAQPDIYLKTINGRAVAQLTSDPAADVQPCLGPQGKFIVFASHRTGNWDLWMSRVDGGRAMQITRSPMHEVHPSLSPDGQRLVYCKFNERAGQWELWLMYLDQPGTERMIGIGLFPEWSPTDDTIAYQRARERGGRWFSIWRVDIEDGEPKFPVELAASPDMALIQPSWNPDGQWVTYGTARLEAKTGSLVDAGVTSATRGDIWVIQKDGSSPVQLTDGEGAHFGPVWGSDGRVYFSSLQNGSENVWSVQPTQSQLTAFPVAAEPNDGSTAENEAFALDLDDGSTR